MKSKQYLLKNNSLILEGKLDNEFISMQKNATSLIKLYKECNEFSLKLGTTSGSILYNLDILKVKKDQWAFLKLDTIFSKIFGLIFPSFFGGPHRRENDYEKNIISKIALRFGFSEKDIYFYGLDKYIFSEKFLKDGSDKDSKNSAEKMESFFEDIIYYIGPIQCALKARDALFQINEIFEKLNNKKDEQWNKFKVEKI